MYRAQLGAANPSDVFLPIMLATFASTLVAILAVCFKQRINIFQKNLLLFFGGTILFIVGVVFLFRALPEEKASLYSTLFANTLLFTIICGFIVSGVRKKINVYDCFIEGAKDGFKTAVGIIPYLVAVLVGVGVFRASGAMDFLIDGVRLGGRGGGDRQPLRRGPAHHPDEAAERERGAGHDARRDEYLRGRLVRGTLGVDCPRLGGYDALRGRALLRECGDTEDEVHRGVLAAGRPGGGIDGDLRRVSVLRIENKKRGTDFTDYTDELENLSVKSA